MRKLGARENTVPSGGLPICNNFSVDIGTDPWYNPLINRRDRHEHEARNSGLY